MSKSTMPVSSSSASEPKRFRADDSAVSESGEQQIEFCFVCDETISGKKYPIANCLTNTTKSRLIEILGRLVSDKYVVVVSTMDKICRTCANSLNNLDKLEYEIMNAKQTLLSSIERKYDLHDDDLFARTVPKKTVVGNAQNIKFSSQPDTVTNKITQLDKPSPFKGSAVMPSIIPSSTTLVKDSILSTTKQVPPSVWMQCNQCQYTTNQRPAMLDHLRQHKAKPAASEDQEKTVTLPETDTSSGMDASALAAVSELPGIVSTNSPIITSSSTPKLGLG